MSPSTSAGDEECCHIFLGFLLLIYENLYFFLRLTLEFCYEAHETQLSKKNKCRGG